MSELILPQHLRPVAADTETWLIQRGSLTPPLVCGSTAERDATGGLQTSLMLKQDTLRFFRRALSDTSLLLVIHNAPFDLAVACSEDPTLIFLVFDAYMDGRICDTIVVQKLIDIALGHRKFRRIGNVVKKASYSLDDLIMLHYNEFLQKEDTWRLSYGLLDGVPLHLWPANAKTYAIHDAVQHLRLYEAQQRLIASSFAGHLPNQLEQQRAKWVLHLMSTWGIRAEKKAVDYFVKHCDEEIAKMHQALLYCLHCGKPRKQHDAVACMQFGDMSALDETKKREPGAFENTGIFKDDGSRTMSEIRSRVVESFTRMSMTVPMTEPSAKFPQGQVGTDKDTLEQTDDPDLHMLAESMTFAKHKGQWQPVLEAAVIRPVVCRYEEIVETGRTASSGSEGQDGTNIQNPPRKGDVRPAIVPRGPKYEEIDVPDDYVLQPGEELVA